MKKKKKKIYCIDGPYQGQTFKVKSGDKEFGVVTSQNPFYETVWYKVTAQIGFTSKLIAKHTHSIEREENEKSHTSKR